MEDLTSIFLIFGLIFLNGAFVAAEFALARVRKTKIDYIVKAEEGTFEKSKVAAARTLQKALENINDYISACQVGITIASLTLGAVAEARIESLIAPILGKIPFGIETHGISIVITITLITGFHVILGEIVPKNIAIVNSETLALNLAGFLNFLHAIFKIPVWGLNTISNQVLGLLGIDINQVKEEVHSEDELKMILNSSLAHGVLEKEEEQLIQNVFDFNDTVAKDVMIPRTDMICLSDKLTIKDAMEEVCNLAYSRYPVYQNKLDNIIGYVSIKDILKAVNKGQTEANITEIISDILKVADGMFVIDLIKLLQEKKKQLALLIDEFGGTSGMVTVEDIVEEIFGEIEDESDVPSQPIKQLTNGDFLVDGLYPLEDLNKEIGPQFKSDHYDTIGGFVFGLVGTEPKSGVVVESDGKLLRVEKHARNRVRLVRVVA